MSMPHSAYANRMREDGLQPAIHRIEFSNEVHEVGAKSGDTSIRARRLRLLA
uniref:Uncharacterized protein n=1 Tax=Solanum lycopersicum TaxID=4081 RepID=A0A3Q7F3K1_SOLLC